MDNHYKYLQSEKTFWVKMYNKQVLIRPVNGEEHFNEPGFSHGFVHFVDPITGERLGCCGVTHFDDNTVEEIL